MAKAGLVGMAATSCFSVLTLASLTGFREPSQASTVAQAGIPSTYLGLYQRAALTCPGLDWTLLAGIGEVESDHGRSNLPGVTSGSNSAGAEGPMQFLPGTFATYSVPVDADPEPTETGGSEPPSPYNPVDSIYASARYLCSSGVLDDVSNALVTYNCGNPGPACQIAAAPYAAKVLEVAASYALPGSQEGDAAAVAVQAALTMIGTPYVWGGDDPTGFDCSGLAQWAFAHSGIVLPRTAQEQFNAGPVRPADQALQAGDLVFFGASATTVTHVGIYVGDGLMVDAPHQGADVRMDRVVGFGDLVGATMPGSGS